MSVSDVFDIFGLNKKPPTDWKKYYIKKPTVCYMKPIYSEEDDERVPRPKIELLHGKFTNIGQDGTVICGNMDVSFTHVTATADLEKYSVMFMYVGTTGAWFNDKAMNRAVRYQLTHGDKIYLQKTKYWYQIVFDPPPSKSEQPERGSKTSNLTKSGSKPKIAKPTPPPVRKQPGK